MTTRHPSIFSRLTRWTALLAGSVLAAASPAQAQTVAPSAAAAEWVRYANDATTAVNRLLEADTETAIRLRAYLDRTRPAPDRPTAPLTLKLWVDKEGTVTRIEFEPFAHAEPNADLRTLIVGQTLAGAPPKDMLLPLRIVIQLDAPAASAAPETGAKGSGHRT
ncbi:hypothetical protein SAMN06295912_1576 [Sphingomonas laterariae]|uniref:Uncharacterized protein n=1 Tax=Edaphosphingomonas laterariae TaxID=861865 RepID=A0A239KQI1_9SPHN|nr:hypothetical protein [Sphingomonas laterariae]SNT19992.1 hypothetical protein SAMN06295912_1576 [Sphingomonas laterariae]